MRRPCLDVIATDPKLTVRDVRVHDAGLISDHRLVLVTLVADSVKQNPPVVFTYRPIRNVDPVDFEQRLRNSSLFLAPESFPEQLRRVIVEIFDEIAPLRQCVRRPPKAISKFLSDEAVKAKRLRRRLERRWLESGLEADRTVYRKACRCANKLINDSRQGQTA